MRIRVTIEDADIPLKQRERKFVEYAVSDVEMTYMREPFMRIAERLTHELTVELARLMHDAVKRAPEPIHADALLRVDLDEQKP